MSSSQSMLLAPDHRPYRAMGAAKELWESNDLEVLICGPVGTGKTRAGLEKIHACCEKWPGTRVLLLRQTRHSLASTALVTFESHVVPAGHPILRGSSREHRYSYRYPNGSEIVLGGMDNVLKVMSGEYDIIYFVELTEGRENDLDMLKTRLRNGVMPFQQFLADCNPSVPNHWLKKRCDRKQMVMLKSELRDNPRFYDGERWTSEGEAYLRQLDGLRGRRRDQLVHGIWAAPEGARFEGANRNTQGFSMHELFPHGFPTTWTRWLSGDWGKADPYCCLWHCSDPNGTVYTYLEDYERGYEADDQAERIVAKSPANERYESMHMDKSMWSKEKSFGGHPEKGPAVTQYTKVFEAKNKELGYIKFGPCVKGASNVGEEAYITLNSRLHDGSWRIELGCLNLWREIEDAVHYQDPKTGVWSELINPVPSRKDCDDHALEAAGYGIHKRSPVSAPAHSDIIDLEKARADLYRANSERNASRSKPNRPNYLRSHRRT